MWFIFSDYFFGKKNKTKQNKWDQLNFLPEFGHNKQGSLVMHERICTNTVHAWSQPQKSQRNCPLLSHCTLISMKKMRSWFKSLKCSLSWLLCSVSLFIYVCLVLNRLLLSSVSFPFLSYSRALLWLDVAPEAVGGASVWEQHQQGKFGLKDECHHPTGQIQQGQDPTRPQRRSAHI